MKVPRPNFDSKRGSFSKVSPPVNSNKIQIKRGGGNKNLLNALSAKQGTRVTRSLLVPSNTSTVKHNQSTSSVRDSPNLLEDDDEDTMN